MNTNPPLRASRGRQGVALVITIGSLAVLAIMALAFAVYVRTERVAAVRHVDVARADDMLQAAIGLVAEQIDQQVGDGMYPRWLWTMDGKMSGCRIWKGTNEVGETDENDYLGIAGTEYLPATSYSTNWPHGRGSYPVTEGNKNRFVCQYALPGDYPEHDIRDPITGDVVAHYYFMAYDISGMLDFANTGAVSQPNREGTAPNEIDIRALLTTEPRATGPIANLPAFGRYHSVREVVALVPQINGNRDVLPVGMFN